MAIRMYFLHKAFPDLVGPEYTLRAVNYILGTHPVSSTSYVAGVGTVSKTKTYNNNRARQCKPFALAELLARLRNLVKRNSSSGAEATRLRVLDLELDLLRREASRSGEILNLTPQEFVLLEYLCRNAGRVVTRSMILDEVWGMRIQPDTNVVDVHIYRLRGKVDTDGRRPLIRTLRGVGYVLKDR